MKRKILHITMAISIFAASNLVICPANAAKNEEEKGVITVLKKLVGYPAADDEGGGGNGKPPSKPPSAWESFLKAMKEGDVTGYFTMNTTNPEGLPENYSGYLIRESVAKTAICTIGAVALSGCVTVMYTSPYILQAFLAKNNCTIPSH